MQQPSSSAFIHVSINLFTMSCFASLNVGQSSLSTHLYLLPAFLYISGHLLWSIFVCIFNPKQVVFHHNLHCILYMCRHIVIYIAHFKNLSEALKQDYPTDLNMHNLIWAENVY